mgnify:CR=1 FL=1|jgi:hypothetical protein
MTSPRIKLIGTIALSLAFALPQYSCAGFEGSDGTFVRSLPDGARAESYEPAVELHYAFEEIDLDDPSSWIVVIVFFWGLATYGFGRWQRGPWARGALRLIEPMLVLMSGAAISQIGSLGTRAWGNSVALGALGVYLVGWGLGVWEWRRAARSTGDGY